MWNCQYIQCTDLHGCNVSCCRILTTREESTPRGTPPGSWVNVPGAPTSPSPSPARTREEPPTPGTPPPEAEPPFIRCTGGPSWTPSAPLAAALRRRAASRHRCHHFSLPPQPRAAPAAAPLVVAVFRAAPSRRPASPESSSPPPHLAGIPIHRRRLSANRRHRFSRQNRRTTDRYRTDPLSGFFRFFF